MNFLAAFVILTIGFWHGVYPIDTIPDNFIKGRSESLLMPSDSYLREQGFLSGSVTTGAALIIEVLPGQLASEIGIMSGDTITTVDNESVNNQNLSTILKSKIGQSVNLTYTRA